MLGGKKVSAIHEYGYGWAQDLSRIPDVAAPGLTAGISLGVSMMHMLIYSYMSTLYNNGIINFVRTCESQLQQPPMRRLTQYREFERILRAYQSVLAKK